jgi:hypothetical protein
MVSGAAKMHPGKTTRVKIVPQQTIDERAVNKKSGRASDHFSI